MLLKWGQPRDAKAQKKRNKNTMKGEKVLSECQKVNLSLLSSKT